MPSLLKIDVSPRGDHSVSRRLGQQFEQAWKDAHAGASVVNRDLATTDMPFVTMPWIAGAYSPEEARNDEQREALKLGDQFISEIEAADHILITTPMYNFAVPAALKAWIDHIVRVGKTFKVNPDGSYVGLIHGKKAIVIIASAGAYGPGTPGETYNAEKPYLKQLLGFIGITDVQFIEAGGSYVLNSGKTSLDDFVKTFSEQVQTAAR